MSTGLPIAIKTMDELVGRRVQQVRLAKCIPAEAAAHAVGLASDEYEAREAGLRPFSFEELIDLTGVLGVRLSAFVEDI